jgi:hypothetical protein
MGDVIGVADILGLLAFASALHAHEDDVQTHFSILHQVGAILYAGERRLSPAQSWNFGDQLMKRS